MYDRPVASERVVPLGQGDAALVGGKAVGLGKLIAAGLPSKSLQIAHVKTRRGEGHAVLVVNTNRGKFVLDNLTQSIKPLGRTGYRVVWM